MSKEIEPKRERERERERERATADPGKNCSLSPKVVCWQNFFFQEDQSSSIKVIY